MSTIRLNSKDIEVAYSSGSDPESGEWMDISAKFNGQTFYCGCWVADEDDVDDPTYQTCYGVRFKGQLFNTDADELPEEDEATRFCDAVFVRDDDGDWIENGETFSPLSLVSVRDRIVMELGKRINA